MVDFNDVKHMLGIESNDSFVNNVKQYMEKHGLTNVILESDLRYVDDIPVDIVNIDGIRVAVLEGDM